MGGQHRIYNSHSHSGKVGTMRHSVHTLLIIIVCLATQTSTSEVVEGSGEEEFDQDAAINEAVNKVTELVTSWADNLRISTWTWRSTRRRMRSPTRKLPRGRGSVLSASGKISVAGTLSSVTAVRRSRNRSRSSPQPSPLRSLPMTISSSITITIIDS